MKNTLKIKFEEFDKRKLPEFDTQQLGIENKTLLLKKRLNGYCNLCDQKTVFSINSENLREDLRCKHCSSVNRQRQLVCTISQAVLRHPDGSLKEIAKDINARKLNIYTAEANSALYQQMVKYINPSLLTASEFFSEKNASGEKVNGTLHEDLQQTSFKNSQFDIIVTTEVFEHIPDAPKAEREVIRILKKGGYYCFTVPIYLHKDKDTILAKMTRWGRILYLKTPQYHGDPVRPEDGILVFRIFSPTQLKERFEKIASSYKTIVIHSKRLGIVGGLYTVMLVKK